MNKLQQYIEMEGLLKDSKKLNEYKKEYDICNKIDMIRDKFADEYDNYKELDIIYRFAEELKQQL